MRVTTIDGGFRGRHLRLVGRAGTRGLAGLSTAQQSSEAEHFIAQFAAFDRVRPLLHHAVSVGALPMSDAIQLEGQFLALGTERDAHINRLATVANDAQLAEWRSTASSIATRASALADRTGVAIGDETGARPWKIAVALVIGGGVFGGLAWLLGRKK